MKGFRRRRTLWRIAGGVVILALAALACDVSNPETMGEEEVSIPDRPAYRETRAAETAAAGATYSAAQATFEAARETEQAAEAATATAKAATPTLTPTIPTFAELSGWYGATVLYRLGDFNHLRFIKMLRWLSMKITQSSITFDGPDPWVDVTGTLAEDGTFTATGKGTVAGFPDIAVSFEGSITLDKAAETYILAGDYTMGTDNKLPGGQSVTYGVEGMRLGDLNAPPLDTATVEEFAVTLSAAIAGKDTDFLLERLHPMSIAFYGEDACRASIEAIDDPGYSVEVLSVSGPDTWQLDHDGLTASVANTYTVEVNVTSGGQTGPSQQHFASINGEVYWFRDCGEALPER